MHACIYVVYRPVDNRLKETGDYENSSELSGFLVRHSLHAVPDVLWRYNEQRIEPPVSTPGEQRYRQLSIPDLKLNKYHPNA